MTKSQLDKELDCLGNQIDFQLYIYKNAEGGGAEANAFREDQLMGT